jgi:hypothetical protein
MKDQRRFAPTSGEFAPESPASFIGISTMDFESHDWVVMFPS